MSETLENLSSETRQFPPPAELAAAANVKAEAYEEAAADRLAYWARQAERLAWAKPWDQVLDWSNPPFAKWFVGGELNVAYNCVDRHVEAGNGDKVAIHWEGEPGDTRTVTYAELLKLVSQAANTLTELGVVAGVGFGDRLGQVLGQIPHGPVRVRAARQDPGQIDLAAEAEHVGRPAVRVSLPG
jgi:acetyl-CoA synthetase